MRYNDRYMLMQRILFTQTLSARSLTEMRYMTMPHTHLV